jgi:hypothetical protein
MLGLGDRVRVGNRGSRLPLLLGQGEWSGEVDEGLGEWVKDCSSFLEGKEELGVEKGLFNVGLSATCVIAGEADMVDTCVSKRVLRDRAVGYAARRWVPEEQFSDSIMGGSVYMTKVLQQCFVHWLCAHKCARPDRNKADREAQERGIRTQGKHTQDSPVSSSSGSRCCW